MDTIWRVSAEDIERAYKLADEYSLLDGKHQFNMKYELAKYFIDQVKVDGKDLSILINMFAYDCPTPVAPPEEIGGNIYECQIDDLDELTDFVEMFHEETGVSKTDREGYRKAAEENI